MDLELTLIHHHPANYIDSVYTHLDFILIQRGRGGGINRDAIL